LGDRDGNQVPALVSDKWGEQFNVRPGSRCDEKEKKREDADGCWGERKVGGVG